MNFIQDCKMEATCSKSIPLKLKQELHGKLLANRAIIIVMLNYAKTINRNLIFDVQDVSSHWVSFSKRKTLFHL